MMTRHLLSIIALIMSHVLHRHTRDAQASGARVRNPELQVAMDVVIEHIASSLHVTKIRVHDTCGEARISRAKSAL